VECRSTALIPLGLFLLHVIVFTFFVVSGSLVGLIFFEWSAETGSTFLVRLILSHKLVMLNKIYFRFLINKFLNGSKANLNEFRKRIRLKIYAKEIFISCEII
jgi:hypothetical protein